MTYDNIKDLFEHICEIKAYVLKLSLKELEIYKTSFYQQRVIYWALNIMWEYIWGDKDYETIKIIFISAKLIKGDKQ